MKIEGLKVFAVMEWKPDSTFTGDNGKIMPVSANHKIICQDDCGDIVNVTFVTPAPLPVKVGDLLKGVVLVGNVSKTSFGWSMKARLEK